MTQGPFSARILTESGKDSGGISDVGPCGEGQIDQRPNNRDIGVLAHL